MEMANGSGYVLNFDFWAPLKDGRVVKRFSKGDTLDGVDLPADFVEKATKGARPMLVKKSSEEGRELHKQEEDPNAAGPTTEAAAERSDSGDSKKNR
jgi:hypothetical protein